MPSLPRGSEQGQAHVDSPLFIAVLPALTAPEHNGRDFLRPRPPRLVQKNEDAARGRCGGGLQEQDARSTDTLRLLLAAHYLGQVTCVVARPLRTRTNQMMPG